MPMDVDKMQKKLASWSQDQDFKFDDIYNLLYDKNWLHQAYRSVEENSGARTAGIDQQTMDDFEENLDENLKGLQKSLKSRTYSPDPVRRTYIPKGDDEERPLGIPTIEDRIVQEALRMVLEPVYETDFSNYSYGFRPNRSTHDAIMSVQEHIHPAGTYMPWVLDLDVKGYFDNVDHGTLGKILQNRITDRKMLKLIWQILKSGIMEDGKYRSSMLGTPQGGIVSPLLANVYLNELDQWIQRWTDKTKYEGTLRRNRGKGNWHFVRYADDFLLLTNGTKKQAETMMKRVRSYVNEKLNLTLSDKKSELNHAEDGFNFLGYYLEAKTDTGGVKRKIPKGAIRDIRDKIRAATQGQTNVSIRAKLKAIDAVVRGWANYYKYATNASRVFNKVQFRMGPEIVEWIADKLDCKHKAVWAQLDNEYPLAMNGVKMTLLTELTENRTKSPLRHTHPYLKNDITPLRENLPSEDPWLGFNEGRKGWSDQRWKSLKRDNWKCKQCGKDITENAVVHHIKPYSRQNTGESNRLENLVSLCEPCHQEIESNRNTLINFWWRAKVP